MKRFLIATAVAMCATVFAQEAATVEREKPLATLQDTIGALNEPQTADWLNGRAYGMTIGVTKLLELLYVFRVTNIPVCIQAGVSNQQLVNAIRDRIKNVQLQQRPAAGTTEDWDMTTIVEMALATFETQRCQ